jgi:hypothetical protein
MGTTGLLVSVVAFIVASYINSNFSSSRDSIVAFQLVYALISIISTVGFIMTILAAAREVGLKRIAFVIAATVSLVVTGWLVVATILVGAFTNL